MDNYSKSMLKLKLKYPLDYKIKISINRIKDFYKYYEGDIYISFSGGKDSTVLLHLVRSIYPEIKAVYCNTGLEYREIIDFVKSIHNVEIIKPKLSFKKVIEKYGYPVISKEIAQKIHEIRTTKSDKLRHKRLYGDNKGNGKIPEKC